MCLKILAKIWYSLSNKKDSKIKRFNQNINKACICDFNEEISA
jgi:hypothetical protein